jgi:hypothetical protein
VNVPALGSVKSGPKMRSVHGDWMGLIGLRDTAGQIAHCARRIARAAGAKRTEARVLPNLIRDHVSRWAPWQWPRPGPFPAMSLASQ